MIKNKINVLIVEDHTIVRKGIMEILISDPDVSEVDEAATAKEAIEKVKNKDYNCVLLDINIPGRNGLEILKNLKCMNPNLPVLILSMYPEQQYGIRSLQAGASGYITKKIPPDELKEAIFLVAQGKKYITPSMADELALKFNHEENEALHKNLSDREYQVMCMIASGKPVSQIAEELNLSVKTVSTHRSRILHKMSMKNNAQITHYAIQESLVF
jgi:two-component system invasion response regulator UvrY